MKQTTALMTAEQLMELPDDAMRYELIAGELHMSPPPGQEHGYYGLNIGGEMRRFLKKTRLGIAVVEVGFLLGRDPDTVLAPDVAFISEKSLKKHGRTLSYYPTPPDLAVEVVSPSDAMTEVKEKVRRYLSAGTKIVWVASPKRQAVTQYAPGVAPVIWGIDDDIDGGELLPGFRMAVRDVFD